jgi:hypothetical protein
MRWLRRGRWKAYFAVAGLLPVLVFMVWVPVTVGAYEGEQSVTTLAARLWTLQRQ